MYKQVLALKSSFTARSSKTKKKSSLLRIYSCQYCQKVVLLGGTVPCRSSGLEIFLGDSLLHVDTGGSTILSEI